MQITFTRPDDWHLHLRDGAALHAVLPHSARQFARAIIMPNLRPPVTTVAAAAEYRKRILAALPALGDAVSGGKRTDGEQRARQLAIIDSELIALHAEHASLGGYYRRT